MGMTIDKAIEIINHYLDYPQKEVRKALLLAIDAMHKHQKIEDIVRGYYNEQYTDKLDIEIIEMISEVLEEDGRWED